MVNCCEIALFLGKVVLVALGVNVITLAIFAGYTITMRKDQVKLKKENQTIKKELAEVERVNGKEKQDIRELQEEVRKLKTKYEK
jgi:uncharacterized protein YlxW (UPF0749 family)